MVKAKLVKQNLSPSSSLSPPKDTDGPILSCVNSLCLGCVHSCRELGADQWQRSGLSWMPKAWLEPCHTSTCSSAFRGGEGAPAALGVWPGSALKVPGSEGGSFPFPVTGSWCCSRADGSEPRSLHSAGWIPYVHHGIKQEWVWLSCADQLVRYVLMAGFEGRGYSGECRGEEKRKNGGGWGLSAVGCFLGIRL